MLRKTWLARIPRDDMPLTSNSYICGIHFLAGHSNEESDSPSIFLGKPFPDLVRADLDEDDEKGKLPKYMCEYCQ